MRAVSAQSTEQPARIDWVFTYADPSVALPAGGEARVAVRSTATRSRASDARCSCPTRGRASSASRSERLVIPRTLLGLAAVGVLDLRADLARSDGWSAARRRGGPRGSPPRWWRSLCSLRRGSTSTRTSSASRSPSRSTTQLLWLRAWAGARRLAVAAALMGRAGGRRSACGIASRTEDPGPCGHDRPSRVDRWLPAGRDRPGWSRAPAAGRRWPTRRRRRACRPSARPTPSRPGSRARCSATLRLTVNPVAGALLAAAVLVDVACVATRPATGAGFIAAAVLGRASDAGRGPARDRRSRASSAALAWWVYRSISARPPGGSSAPMLLCVAVTRRPRRRCSVAGFSGGARGRGGRRWSRRWPVTRSGAGS